MSRQARGLERRNQIVAAAQEVLLRDGFAALTHRSVAAQAGVPLGSTTYYFSDRQELVRAAVDAFLDGEQQRRRRIVTRAPTLPAVSRALVTLMIPPATARPEQVARLYQRYAESLTDPQLAVLIRDDSRDLHAHARRLLATVGLEDRTDMVLALLDGRIIQWLATGSGPRRLTSTITDDLGRITG